MKILSELPYDVHWHIFKYLSENDQLKLATLQNRNLNSAIKPNILEFYDKVYKYLPCGIWFSSTERKIYEITLKPGPVLHINYYPMFTRKQLSFSRGLKILKNFTLLKENEQLIFNKTTWFILDKSLRSRGHYTINNYPIRTNVSIFLHKGQVTVKLFNRNNIKKIDTFLFKNNKLVKKCRDDISRQCVYYFLKAF